MRNPSNSIRCQNLLQKQLNEKINELINSNIGGRKLKSKLRKILRQYVETVRIQMSSERILNFLVNDILDFAQMRSGKFRKSIQTFNIVESVEEIVDILKFKAQNMNIAVQT